MKTTNRGSHQSSTLSEPASNSLNLEVDSDLNVRITLPQGVQAADLIAGLPTPPRFGFLLPPPVKGTDHIETLVQWGDLPPILLIPEAAAFIAERCKQNPAAIQKVIAGAILKGEIPCWGCSEEGGWKKGMIRVLYRSDMRREAGHIKMSTCISEGGRLHVEAMGINPRDVIGLLMRRGRKVPTELLDLIDREGIAGASIAQAEAGNAKNSTLGHTRASDLGLSSDASAEWIQRSYWTERELEALSLGIDPQKYGDREDVADQVLRDQSKEEIDAAIRTGRLRAKPKEGRGPAEVLYRCQWEIEPHSAILWAEGQFPAFPRFLVKDEMRRRYREQEEAKCAAGRFTLKEAARAIAVQTEDAEDICVKLLQAAISGALPVYLPGRLTKHTYREGETAREFYEEAYWDDLNAWLEANEHRLTYRFPTPSGQVFAKPSEGSSRSIEAIPRQRAQEQEILKTVRDLGYTPECLPKHRPGFRGVKAEVREKNKKMTKSVFDKAWERLRASRELVEVP